MGDRLFRALFTEPVARLLGESRGIQAAAEGGLRIQLRFAAGNTPAEQLPWELMYRAQTREFLALDPRSPVVRYIEMPRPVPASTLPSSLNVLVVAANPEDLADLDVGQERRNIEASCRRAAAEVTFLESATLRGVQRAVTERDFHIVHFTCHGVLDRETGTSGIALEDSKGYACLISGDTLATHMKASPGLFLVCLSACETARVSTGPTVDPLAGVAKALVLAGIPYVLAMQSPITDSAAISFGAALYQSLLRNRAMESAITCGRLAIHATNPATAEWATPVLFARRSIAADAAGSVSYTPQSGRSSVTIGTARDIKNTWIAGRDIKPADSRK